jgi:hypothetical protein
MQAAMSAAEAAQTRAIDKALASQPSERESYRPPPQETAGEQLAAAARPQSFARGRVSRGA